MNQMNNKPSLPKRIRNHVNPLADQLDINFAGFENPNPIMVDIGAYRGEFAQQLVDNFSDTHNFIVTEIRKPFAHYLRDIFAQKSNVAVFNGDSARNIRGLLKQSVDNGVLIDYIFINFPDPWFKEKHKKRRVLNTNFLDELADFIDKKTNIVFQTDQKPMFDETVELIEEHGKFDIQYFTEPLWGIQSYWETMKIKEGDSINRMNITLHTQKNM